MFLCGGVCFLYYGVICATLHKWDSTFSRFWPTAGMIFFICAALIRWTNLDREIYILLSLTVILFLYTEGRIIARMSGGNTPECRYIIVLGAHVEGKQITDSLKRRLDRAFVYLKAYPKTIAVLSGGQGEGEDITEAEAMSAYLSALGIEPERLVLEKHSTTTKENLEFSKALIGKLDEPMGIVSNHFHLYRACLLAKKCGYTKVYPLPSNCHLVLLPNYMMREFFAVWKVWMGL